MKKVMLGIAIETLFAVLLIGLVFASNAIADETPAAGDRPKNGLVLSGGGARGGVQIGFLRGLEELRVPIDYIATTSIGAAVGGLYACGMPVDELETFVMALDSDEVFTDGTPRRFHTYPWKRHEQRYPVDQRLGFDGGKIGLPLGLIHGQGINETLMRATLPCAGTSSFDDLKIPFRAVAGDIATGEAVTIGSGNLALVIRASLSVPGVMAPWEIDGRQLVDGGIATNLPVSVARSMGADRVIAIDASEPLAGSDEIDSVDDIIWQLTTLLTEGGSNREIATLAEDDFLLIPELPQDLTSTKISRLADGIEIGYELAMRNRERLRGFALDEAAYARYRESLVDPRWSEPPIVEFVRIRGALVDDSVIEDRIHDIAVGEPLDVDALEVAIDKLMGLWDYQNVVFTVVQENGATGLELHLIPYSQGPEYLQPGLIYNASNDDDDLLNFAVSYQKTAINAHGGDFHGTVYLGDEPGLRTNLYQPVGDAGRYFVSPELRYASYLLDRYQGNVLDTELRVRELTLEFGAGRELGFWGEFRGGIRTSVGESNLRLGAVNPLGDDEFHRGELFARLAVDTFDDIEFPREGVLASLEWRGSGQDVLGAEHDFDQLSIGGAQAQSFGKYTLLSSFRYDATVSGRVPVDTEFELGGFQDLSGLKRGQLSGQHVARIGANVYRQILEDRSSMPIFVGLGLELGNAWDTRDEISARSAVLGRTLWAGVNTRIGPVRFGYSKADGHHGTFYFSFGRVR